MAERSRLRQAMQRPCSNASSCSSPMRVEPTVRNDLPKRLSTLSDGLADCCEPFKSDSRFVGCLSPIERDESPKTRCQVAA